MLGNFAEDHRAGGDFRPLADGEGSENLGAGAHGDVFHKGRVALSGLLAGTAQGHALVKGAAVAHLGGLADDDAGAVVNENSPPELCRRVYLNAGEKPHNLGQKPGGETKAMVPEPVRRAVPHYRVKPRIENQDAEGAGRRRVALANGGNIFFKTVKHQESLLF